MGNNSQPFAPKKRYVSLDALRGFALMGICLANYPEFSLYSFQTQSYIENMPSYSLDKVVKFLQYLFIDGKFYTIFSILFGIGFSIIIENARQKGKNGFKIFYRRMFCLLVIGLLHLMFLWSGDILMLYALMGMILPLFRNIKTSKLLNTAFLFLCLPYAVELFRYTADISLADYPYRAWWSLCAKYGITKDNFAFWLSDAKSYKEVFQFLIQGSAERMWEFVLSSRYFKVLGLFLIGFCIGKEKIYANLSAYKKLFKRLTLCLGIFGFITSVFYAFANVGIINLEPLHLSFLYIISVYPLGIAYICIFALLYMRYQDKKIWTTLAYPGRMALTNYIMQSVFGIIIF